MFLDSILDAKGRDVRTTSSYSTLSQVVDDLVAYNIGSLVVSETMVSGAEGLLGIVTERDILRAQASGFRSLAGTLVRDIMSPQLVTASPHDTTATAMKLMTHHCIRHLPLVEQGALVGIVSIGDILKTQHEELQRENYCMKAYILGESNEMLALTS